MSAKRRADTIARFSVPIKDTPPVVDEESVGRSSRLRPATESQPQPIEIDDDEDNGSNFAPDDQSDYSATEFESDDEPRAKRDKGKGKGKGKMAPKGKAPAKSSILEALGELDVESNPRVMLISLKGGCFTRESSTALTTPS